MEKHKPHSSKRNPAVIIKAIIFDCDGTLVDSEFAHYTAWKHALQKHGGSLTVEEYYHYVGKSTETNERLLAEKIGKKDRAEEIHKDKLTRFHELQAQGLPPIEGTVDFIHRLARDKEKLGLKLGIASAVGKQEILSHLRNLGIESYFDVILSGTEDLVA